MPLGFLLLVLSLLAGPAAGGERLPDEAALLEGFRRVVFTAEIPGPFSDPSYVKKFAVPVRFRVENEAGAERGAAVEAFVNEIDAKIGGLEARMARPGERAEFVVHIVGRARYQAVGRRVYRNPFMHVPGHCIVRATFSTRGIAASEAILVADEGEARFRRCLVEEILQGLGPLADNPDAPDSAFNDRSTVTRFTLYDRAILEMLYDRRLRPGMRAAEAAPLLPGIARDVLARLR